MRTAVALAVALGLAWIYSAAFADGGADVGPASLPLDSQQLNTRSDSWTLPASNTATKLTDDADSLSPALIDIPSAPLPPAIILAPLGIAMIGWTNYRIKRRGRI